MLCLFFALYIFDGWSIVKLTGSKFVFSLMFFFDILNGWSIVKMTGLCGWS